MQPPDQLKPVFQLIRELEDSRDQLLAHSRRLKFWTKVSLWVAGFNGLCGLLNLAWLWFRMTHKL
jgi:hypothetical protein